jgi:hypothetical protein
MLTPRTTGGYPPAYALSTIFFIMALAGIVVLIGTDILHHLRFSLLHQRLDAWPLTMIGLSYIALNLAGNLSRADRIKGIIMGVAFLLWGGEQLIPPSRISTVMDEGAVTIFVVDVTFIIWSRIRV